MPLPIEEMVLDWKIIPDKNNLKSKVIDNQGSQDKSKTSKKVSAKGSLPPSQDKGDKKLSLEQNLLSNKTAKDKTSQDQEDSGGIFDKYKNFFSKDEKNSNQNKKDKKTFSKQGEDIKILLTAAPKNLVEKYVRIFRSAELELVSLETEAFALERSLIGNSSSTVMIIDIGAISSDVGVIKNGIPVLTRSIDVGGSSITKAVMNNMSVDLSRAEQFKRDIGFHKSGPGDLPEIIKNTINPIINEVKYCLDIYLSQDGSQDDLEKIVLTGGSAFLPDLVNYLNKLLDIKVIIGDPWDRVVYPMELKPALDDIGPRFSVAVGLAMREI